MKILCGDIGGTKTRLALYSVTGSSCECLADEKFPSKQHASLAEIAVGFLDAHRLRCHRACFGIAGPIQNQRSETTNLPWIVDAAELAAALNAKQVRLINDLEAMAYGIAALDKDELATLSAGQAGATGNAGVIAAGTGLGQAGLYWNGREHVTFGSEGGHASFAPGSELEVALYRWLAGRYGHVSWERVLSGPGLGNIYEFLCEYRKVPADQRLRAIEKGPDLPTQVTDAGLAGQPAIAAEALTVFMRFYGAEAANLALKLMATGGIYLGGGIAPKILPKLRGEPTFLKAFVEKGRMQRLMKNIPVHVILSTRTPLLGALRCAMNRIVSVPQAS